VIGFVHIPKTGGSTVKFVLRNSFGIRHCDFRAMGGSKRLHPGDLALARRVHPGLRSISGHSLIHPTQLLAGVEFFTYLRDPVSRVASAYAHHVRGSRGKRRGEPTLSLEAFVAADRPGGFQVFQVCGGPDVAAAKRILEERFFFVGLTERFDESLAGIASLSPIPLDTRYRRKNVAPAGDPVKRQVTTDPGMRAVVEKANAADRELYEWVVADLYPRRLAEARARAGERFGAAGETEVGNGRVLLCRAWNNAVFRILQRGSHALGLRAKLPPLRPPA
jgi:hypothetical protein